MALSYLVGSATQGGADAYIEAEIATALSGNTTNAFQVREIVIQFPRALTAGATLQDMYAGLWRRTKAAFPNANDRDVIISHGIAADISTNGGIDYNWIVRFAFSEDDQLLVVEDPIYFGFDSTGTGATSTAYVRVGYTVERISAIDRLTLLTQSLE